MRHVPRIIGQHMCIILSMMFLPVQVIMTHDLEPEMELETEVVCEKEYRYEIERQKQKKLTLTKTIALTVTTALGMGLLLSLNNEDHSDTDNHDTVDLFTPPEEIRQHKNDRKAPYRPCSNTPLIDAIQRHRPDFKGIKKLINQKNWLHERDANENSPLHIACSLNKKSIVKLLLKHKASVNTINQWGQTPLHLLCQNIIDEEDINLAAKQCKIVTLLRRYGASCTLTDTVDHKTVVELAQNANNATLQRSLLRPLKKTHSFKSPIKPLSIRLHTVRSHICQLKPFYKHTLQ